MLINYSLEGKVWDWFGVKILFYYRKAFFKS
jgi:hypothetical protein